MKRLLILLMLACTGNVFGQFVLPLGFRPDTLLGKPVQGEPYMIIRFAPPEPFMLSSIQYVGDFQKRFNYQTTPSGKQMTDALSNSISRRECVASLFDHYDARLGSQKPFSDQYVQTKELLIQQILYGEIYLPDVDSSLFAALDFTADHQGKSVKGTMYLKKARGPYGYVWKIFDVDAPFLSKTKDQAYFKSVYRDSTTYSIKPHSHETNFLSLYGLLHAGIPLLKLGTESLGYQSMVAALSKAIQKKECVLDQFNVSLFIPLGSQLLVKLNEFNREAENSGWLISDIFSDYSASRLPNPFYKYFPDLQSGPKSSFK